jgi:hypothetical protein
MNSSFERLDQIATRVRSHVREPEYSTEVASRLARAVPTSDVACLRALAELIAYSQQAKSAAVSDMIEAGRLDAAFKGFDVATVAALDADAVVEKHWRNLTPMRFPKKVNSIVASARAMMRLETKGRGLIQLLHDFPRPIRSREDIEAFWMHFSFLRQALQAADMPFFGRVTSLLHLLLHFGFDCVKPDKVVQDVAISIGLLREKPREPDLLGLVRALQEYAVSRGTRPAVVDLDLLIEGRQTWALQFLKR